MKLTMNKGYAGDMRFTPVEALRRGMQTYKSVELPDGSDRLKPDVILLERWDDTQGFVHNGQWPHLSWKTNTGHLVVYSHGAYVWTRA